jgi:serine phosphatase RsbU (regulator of sigma subunit)
MMACRYPFLLLLITLQCNMLAAQEGFNNRTRALYILDISKYIGFDESFAGKSEFVISVLDRDDRLYWELERLAATRKTIQGKPIRVLLCARIEQITPSSVVFVNQEDQYNISEVLEQIKGCNTLLISEGYPFRTSMINFVVVEGEPRFEANEALMREEGLFVNELFLAQAVKTLEDWEALYEVTEDELEMEKNITEQQYILIERQMGEISRQKELIKENNLILETLRNEIYEREQEIEEKSVILQRQEGEIKDQKSTIEEQMQEVKAQKGILADQQENIRSKEKTIARREEEIRQQDEKIILQAEAIQKQKIIILAAVVALVLVFGLGYFIWVNYRNKKKANVLLKAQRDQIAYQKKHITDSIEYAEKIQRAILPSLELFTDKLDHFVLFKPRDIVSGDFYWVEEVEGRFVIITADCTGHGVPGAFMSMLGISLLNEIVLTKGITRPDEILNALRLKIIEALKQEAGGEVKDGMDMTVCVLDPQSGRLLFSGANNPLYHIRRGELRELKGDKMPVAIHEVMEPFTLHELSLERDDSLYTFSDGYSDQFGGPSKKKFLVKNFRRLLLSIQELPMIDQGVHLDRSFEDYRKEMEQIDDVVVIGVRV